MSVASRPRLLVLDSAYSLHVLRARGLEQIVTSRCLDGFFEAVWSVHPHVGSSPDDDPGDAFGPPTFTRMAPRHTFVEGHAGRFRGFAAVPPLNFALSQIGLIRVLAGLIRRERIDALAVANPYYLGLLGLCLARARHIPLVLRVNANYDAIYESTGDLAYPRLLRWRWLERALARVVFPRAAMVIVGSRDNEGFALANGAVRSRIRRLHQGDAIAPLHFEGSLKGPDVGLELGLADRPYVICVSRLERVKLVQDVLPAVAVARRSRPDLAVVFVGDGRLRGKLEEDARLFGLEGHVRFAGNRDQLWLAAALRGAAAVVVPLAGRALVEAALSGTAIAAYDVEWHGEVIEDGETGLLVPARDVRGLGAAIARLVEQPGLAQTLGTRARATVADMMNPLRVAERKRDEYTRLLLHAA